MNRNFIEGKQMANKHEKIFNGRSYQGYANEIPNDTAFQYHQIADNLKKSENFKSCQGYDTIECSTAAGFRVNCYLS